jgi:hypothetical protein
MKRRILPAGQACGVPRWAAAMLTAVLVAALPVSAIAQQATPSLSKLSIHLLLNYTAGARQVVAANPRVLKILDTHTSMLQAARDYKARTPGGIVVLRIYTAHRYSLSDNPTTAAEHFWNSILAPKVNALSPQDRALIDYLEGPNEADSTPTWNSPAEVAWYNAFWMRLAPLIASAGFKPCAYSISVGNPPGSLQEIYTILDTIAPSLRVVKQLGGAWSYHPYTILYTKDVGVENWFSLRYRLFYSYFATRHPDLVDLPMILTEGGVDGQSSPIGPGWKGGGDAAKFIDWLAWWDNEIRKDPYILGCTLFQIGDPVGWWSFDLEPIASWLAQHLRNNRATGTVRQARQASNGQAVTISGSVVSAAFPGVLYVQSPDRAHGVRVEKANHGVQPGARVDVSGVARTNSDGEKYIQADWVSGLGTGPVVPLSIRASSLGGGPWLYNAATGAGQRGVSGGTGVNNFGLLATVWGRVTSIQLSPPPTRLMLDDGSGKLIRVDIPGGVIHPGVGAYVRATGPVSCYASGGSILPRLLLRGQSDLQVLSQ